MVALKEHVCCRVSELAQMLGENLLAKFKKTPMAIAAMRALKGESACRPEGPPGFNSVGSIDTALLFQQGVRCQVVSQTRFVLTR